jgi:hypothetical protein
MLYQRVPSLRNSMSTPFTLEYTVPATAHTAALADLGGLERRRTRSGLHWVRGGVLLTAALGVVSAQQHGLLPALPAPGLGLVLVLVLGLALGLLVARWLGSATGLREAAGMLAGPCRLEIEGGELVWRQGRRTLRIGIAGVTHIEEVPSGLVVCAEQRALLWIPVGAFTESQPVAELLGAIAQIRLSGVGETRRNAHGFLPLLRGYLFNVGCGLACAVFWPLPGARIDSRPAQWLALAATLLVSTGALEYAATGAAGQFNPAAIPGLLFLLPVLLVAGGVAGAVAGRSSAMAQIATLGLAASIFSEPVCRLLIRVPGIADRLATLVPEEAFAQTLNAAWLGLALALAFLWRLRPGPVRAVPAVAVLMAVMALAQAVVPYDDALWVIPDDSEAGADPDPGSAANAWAAEDGVAGEERLYRESHVLDGTLGHLAPARRDRVNLYFVGFAGTATQDVFMKETHSIGKLFERRFQAGAHSVLLVNNPATLDAEPMATRSALAQTLTRIGSLMDPERDILFLYMTSHGSPDHSFAVSFPPWPLASIRPEDLREMLDEAGIRNRVVVISACYSGGFIDALKTDYSLIMTAAAADRSSFGCSSEEDFTYFGRAYFDEALRSTSSFVEAFRLAAPNIARREAEQGFVPSEPQLYEGARIAPILRRFEHQLQR